MFIKTFISLLYSFEQRHRFKHVDDACPHLLPDESCGLNIVDGQENENQISAKALQVSLRRDVSATNV